MANEHIFMNTYQTPTPWMEISNSNEDVVANIVINYPCIQTPTLISISLKLKYIEGFDLFINIHFFKALEDINKRFKEM
jgi:hypothetical protein